MILFHLKQTAPSMHRPPTCSLCDVASFCSAAFYKGGSGKSSKINKKYYKLKFLKTWETHYKNIVLRLGMCRFSVVQAIRCLPPTAGVPSLHLGHSMCALSMKSSLCRFFSGFLTFSPTTNFIPPLFHTHLIPLVSFVPVMVHQATSLLFTDLQQRGFIASHLLTRP